MNYCLDRHAASLTQCTEFGTIRVQHNSYHIESYEGTGRREHGLSFAGLEFEVETNINILILRYYTKRKKNYAATLINRDYQLSCHFAQ